MGSLSCGELPLAWSKDQYVSMYLSVCLLLASVCMSAIHLQFICLPAYLPACLPSFLSVCLSTCLPVCLPACLPVCLSVCLPACLPACLSTCLSDCLSILLSMLPLPYHLQSNTILRAHRQELNEKAPQCPVNFLTLHFRGQSATSVRTTAHTDM